MGVYSTLEYPKVKFKVKENIVDTWEDVIFVYNDMLDSVLKKMIEELSDWIMKHVPAKTQALRADIIRNLQGSQIINNSLQLNFGTTILYAGVVSAMPTNRVRHFGEWSRGYWLEDSEAIGGWMEELQVYAYDRLVFHLQTSIDMWFAGYGHIMRSIRGGTQVG